MGLDTSHGAWHGAYSAFTRWRNQLAEAAGYQVGKIDLGTPEKPDEFAYIRSVIIDWGHTIPKNFEGDWDETLADPLMVLIVHSDCDGVIHPEHAGPLADRLEELLPLLPEGDVPGHIGNWRTKTETFIRGLRKAAAAGEDLEFG